MVDEPSLDREPADGRLTIVVGVLGKAHALKGEVEVITGTDEPRSLLRTYTVDDGRVLTATSVRNQSGRLVISFDEVTDRNGAEALRGMELRIPADDRRALPDGEWWPEDLVGLAVVSVDGAVLGTVAEVAVGGPQDRLVVTGTAGSFEVPFVEALVPEVDVDGGRVVVDLPDGLQA